MSDLDDKITRLLQTVLAIKADLSELKLAVRQVPQCPMANQRANQEWDARVREAERVTPDDLGLDDFLDR